MKSRQEIKAIGKSAMKANYWNCVLVIVLVTAVLNALSWIANGDAVAATMSCVASAPGDMQALVEASAASGTSLKSSAGSLLFLLVSGPLSIGLCTFFIENLREDRRPFITVTTPFQKAFDNYPRKLGATLLVGIFTFLWSLLLIIPGIIKAYAYSMTQYILADYPDVKAQDAIKLSTKMMKGHKWEYFVLQLSFIGWWLLSVLTMGILSVFYVSPWMESACAAYYTEIRDEAIRNGTVTAEQLAGWQAA